HRGGIAAEGWVCTAGKILRNGGRDEDRFHHHSWSQTEHSSFMAAWYTAPGKFKQLYTCFLLGGGEEFAQWCAVDMTPYLWDKGLIETPAAFSECACETAPNGDMCGTELTEAQRNAS